MFAQTEIKVKIFGRNKSRVVPTKIFRKQRTVDHDAGVLYRVGVVHHVVDSNVGNRKDFLAGDLIVRIYGEALAADNDHARVSQKVFNLFLKAIRQGNVISVHAGDIQTFGFGEAKIEGTGNFLIGFVAENTKAGVKFGVFLKNFIGIVGGGIVNSDDFKV